MNFARSIEITASPAELFALTQDYARRLTWDPFLRSAELVGGAQAPGVGVRAYCVAHNGLGMETEYVSYDPPHVCAVKMTNRLPLIRAFAGSWRFEELAPGRTRVGFRYNLHARPRWLAWLLTPLVGWIFARDTARRLSALKQAVEDPKPFAARN